MPGKQTEKQRKFGIEFVPANLDLLVEILKLRPEMFLAAQIGVRAREAKISYPIQSSEGLRGIANDRGAFRLGKKSAITMREVERFFPKEFYPVQDESDFIRKLVMAATLGHIEHLKEETQEALKRGGKGEIPPPIVEADEDADEEGEN